MIKVESRTPHGVRGLKFTLRPATRGGGTSTSHPSWGAWIEISYFHSLPFHLTSHPSWGAWIEIP